MNSDLENKYPEWINENFKELTELNLTNEEWQLLYSVSTMIDILMLQNDETKIKHYDTCFMFKKFMSKLYWIDKNSKEREEEENENNDIR